MAALAAEKLAESPSPLPPESREVRRNDPAVEAAFQAVPENMVAEIMGGQLHTMPRPSTRHGLTSTGLTGALHGPFRRGVGGPGGWVLIAEPEIHLGPLPDKLVPDLAGWRRERFPTLPVGEDRASIDVAPDWVCEILSPSTETKDRIHKMRIYLREGVKHVWLIHPQNRTLEVYCLEGQRWVQTGSWEGDEVVRAEPFQAIEIDLTILWDDPSP